MQRIFTRGPSPEEDDTDVQQPGEPAKEVELECMQPLPTPPQQQSAEPGQQEEELTEAVAASTLPPEVIQSYRASIRDLDPNIPIFTLRMEDMGDFDIHALFPDLLTYEPPNPSFNDPYFDELEYGRIVPISRLLSRRITFARPRQHSRKRKIDGQVVSIQDETDVNDVAPLLPRNERYDNTQLIPRKSLYMRITFAKEVLDLICHTSTVCSEKDKGFTGTTATSALATKCPANDFELV